MTAKQLRQLPYEVYGSDDDYADHSIVIVDACEGCKHGICASSDNFDEDVRIFASYNGGPSNGNSEPKWERFKFSPIVESVAEMALHESNILEDDHLIVHKPTTMSKAQMLMEWVEVSTAAHEYLHLLIAIRVLLEGISDYAEAQDNKYHETRFITAWGEGEEGLCASEGQSFAPGRIPTQVGFFSEDYHRLLNAIDDPKWCDVPYIKLIREGEALIL